MLPAFIREFVSLAPFTTLGVGGPAHFFATCTTESEIAEALRVAAAHQWPVFILGGGSNLLVSDAGFAGLVIQVALRGISTRIEQNTALVTAAAGEPWDELVAHCVQHSFAGLECLSGIPGLVGGTPVQNVGAYGQEVSETIVQVTAFDRQLGQRVTLSNADCQFDYRRSRFNTTERERYVVLNVTYALQVNGAPALRYADLQKFFASASSAPALADVRQAVLAIRRRKGMVLDAQDPDTRSAGSFFKNPVLQTDAFARLEVAARQHGLITAQAPIPSFPSGATHVKVPAAWLIEKAGFQKGYRRGRAGLSSKHPLALVNYGGATASEIVALMREIQAGVRAQFAVALEPEPVFLGFTETEIFG